MRSRSLVDSTSSRTAKTNGRADKTYRQTDRQSDERGKKKSEREQQGEGIIRALEFTYSYRVHTFVR